MFIVFENNPQLFNVSDGFKLFHKPDEAARYALNRGLINPYGTTVAKVIEALSTPGKGLTGGGTGVAITVANIEPVDAPENAVSPESQLSQAWADSMTEKVKSLEKQLDDNLTNTAQAVDAVTVQLEESEKKVADLQAQLAAATAGQKNDAQADKKTTETV